MMLLRTLARTTVAAVAAAVLSFSASAGPPLLCHQFQIGDARSLPWGGPTDPFAKSKKYDGRDVVEQTLGLLDGTLPVLVRMETLRRATLYIGQDKARAERLLGSLLSRTLDAEVVMEPKVLALRYFDAGYFAATLSQAGIETSFGPTNGEHDLHRVPGYAWLARACKMTDLDGDMAAALALVTADTRMSEHTMFLEQAIAASKPTDAARNDLLQWICQIRGTTLEAARAKVATEHARSER